VKANSRWDCEWSVKDDAMLLVGILKHGFGNWEAIQADDDLPFADKFFLDDGKKKAKDAKEKKKSKDEKKGPRSPAAVHLVRRGEFLLHTLSDVDTAAQNIKGSSSRHDSPAGGPSKPRAKIASAVKPKASKAKGKGKAGSPDESGSSKKSKPSKAAGKKEKAVKKEVSESGSESDEQSSYSSMDEEECKSMLRPVKKELKELKKGTDHLDRTQKVTVLKDCLSAVGSLINQLVDNTQGNQVIKERQRKHLWTFASYFWPSKGVSHKQLSAMAAKMLSKSGPAPSPSLPPPSPAGEARPSKRPKLEKS